MASDIKHQIINGKDCKDLAELADGISTWPTFMKKDPVANRHWAALYNEFAEYQFGMFDSSTGNLMAAANSIPLTYDGKLEDLPDEGWDWALNKSVNDYQTNLRPNIQCAIQIAVSNDFRGLGLSQIMLKAMKNIGRNHGLNGLIAPVRPNLKHKYPLTPMSEYIKWKTDDGKLFDPWLRVHTNLGARIIKVCPESMRMSGTIDEWEEWTEMKLPDSGEYIITEALNTVIVDEKKESVTYIEPNVWMFHDSPN
ncbi:MAG: GNAT family N-acetyltransferase [candidate division Zixibacteria bacterium]|nr:GNAT family N-acetyltransferase [candidate division Zixibacteria bacterium]